MSILNTTATPQFLAEPPDWSKPVSVETAWATNIMEARDGSEQRSRRRDKARFRLAYTLAALNIGQFSVRRAKSLLEQAAAVVAPVWTDEFTLEGASVGTGAATADLGESLTLQKFKVGSYAYFQQAGKTSTFRRILAVDGDTLDLAAGGADTFTAGATVIPCILGLPAEGANFQLAKLDDSDEAVVIEEL